MWEALFPGPHPISVVSQGPKSTEGWEGVSNQIGPFGVCCTPARPSGENLLIQLLIRTCQGPKKELGRVSQSQRGRRESR